MVRCHMLPPKYHTIKFVGRKTWSCQLKISTCVEHWKNNRERWEFVFLLPNPIFSLLALQNKRKREKESHQLRVGVCLSVIPFFIFRFFPFSSLSIQIQTLKNPPHQFPDPNTNYRYSLYLSLLFFNFCNFVLISSFQSLHFWYQFLIFSSFLSFFIRSISAEFSPLDSLICFKTRIDVFFFFFFFFWFRLTLIWGFVFIILFSWMFRIVFWFWFLLLF